MAIWLVSTKDFEKAECWGPLMVLKMVSKLDKTKDDWLDEMMESQ